MIRGLEVSVPPSDLQGGDPDEQYDLLKGRQGELRVGEHPEVPGGRRTRASTEGPLCVGGRDAQTLEGFL